MTSEEPPSDPADGVRARSAAVVQEVVLGILERGAVDAEAGIPPLTPEQAKAFFDRKSPEGPIIETREPDYGVGH